MARYRADQIPPDLDALRHAIREAVVASSGHVVAKQLGMSRSWIGKFVAGGVVPREKTARLIRDWCSAHPSDGPPPPPEHRAEPVPPADPAALVLDGALGLLLVGLSPDTAKAIRASALTAVARSAKRQGVELPDWFYYLRS